MLAIVVLAGKKGGKGLAVAALVINILVLVGWGALIALGVILGGTPIDDLKTGQCFTADGLTSGDDGVSRIEVVGCTKEHDGEVLAVDDFSTPTRRRPTRTSRVAMRAARSSTPRSSRPSPMTCRSPL